MPSRFALGVVATLLLLASGAHTPAQLPGSQYAAEISLTAKSRLYPDLVAGDPPRPAGPRAMARDSAGQVYLLISQIPGVRGSVVYVYAADGKRLRQIPPTGAPRPSALAYASDLTLAADGRVFIADRGGDALKSYSPEGTLLSSIPIESPASVVALKDGEVALTSLRSEKLVAVFDARGRLSREFGDPAELSGRAALNRFLNLARLATDSANNIYLAFSFVPEPTLRKYDAFGYLAFETSLSTLDFAPVAQATRRAITRYDLSNTNTPRLPPVVDAIAIDPASGEAWVAVGPRLIHFDRNGDRRATYRPFTPDGIRIEVSAILLEPDRIVLASESLGVFDFSRPDKPTPPPSKSK